MYKWTAQQDPPPSLSNRQYGQLGHFERPNRTVMSINSPPPLRRSPRQAANKGSPLDPRAIYTTRALQNSVMNDITATVQLNVTLKAGFDSAFREPDSTSRAVPYYVKIRCAPRYRLARVSTQPCTRMPSGPWRPFRDAVGLEGAAGMTRDGAPLDHRPSYSFIKLIWGRSWQQKKKLDPTPPSSFFGSGGPR